VDQAQSVVQAQACGTQRGPPVIGQRAAHRQTVAAHHLSLVIGPPRDRPFDRPHPAHLLLEFLLSVPIGLEEGPRRFPEVMELTELVRHTGQDGSDRIPDRMLPVGDHPGDGHGQRGDRLP